MMENKIHQVYKHLKVFSKKFIQYIHGEKIVYIQKF